MDGAVGSLQHKDTSVCSTLCHRHRLLGSNLNFTDWLDGGMITLAFFTINFFHPGLLIGPGPWMSLRSNNPELEKNELAV